MMPNQAEVSLVVHAVMPDGTILKAGRLLSRNLHAPGRYEGFFKYDAAFVRHPQAYALDPVHLPLLANKVFVANSPNIGLHGVFEDSLPDAWGQQILLRQGNLHMQRSCPVHLLAVLHNQGLGSLIYSVDEKKPALAQIALPFERIHLAIKEAGQLEQSLDTEIQDLQHLLACGSSAGGARPKVLTEKDGRLYLAKLSSIRDPEPNLLVALEQAGMLLARQAGVPVPDFEVCSIGQRNIFLIQRFDTVGDRGRNALISFKTLLVADDVYAVRYAALAQMLRMFSCRPQEDVESLYRQMLVHVCLRNTDDHLQNFSILHTKDGYALSPAYDIVPNLYQAGQILQVNGKHEQIGRDDVLEEGKAFGLSTQKARKILVDVLERLENWQDVFATCGALGPHTGKLKEDIATRFIAIKKRA
jgi:serine/threonine-protein kinase HipA